MGESGAKRKSRAKGARYEAAAAEYLERRDYNVLERNYRSRFGEIDLIALSPEGAVVFVEVKYRAGDACGDPAEAVDAKKQRRIERTARMYLLQRGLSEGVSCRFDVIAILGREDGEKTLRHIENAFGASW